MAKRYYNLEKETKAFLKRMEETRGVLPDSAGIARINDYIAKRKGLGLILGTRNRVAQVFNGIDFQRLQISDAASNLSLRAKSSWEMVAWVRLRPVTTQRELISKANNNQTLYEYSLVYNNVRLSLNSSNGTITISTAGKNVTQNTWNFTRFGRNGSTNNLFISLNNDVPNTLAQTVPIVSTNAFSIGDWSQDGASRPGNCDIDSVGRWDRVLTVAEYDFIYNSGGGVSFYEILGYQPSLLNGLVSYWQLSEGSGIRYDWWGNNHLTPNFTLTTTFGVIDKFF